MKKHPMRTVSMTNIRGGCGKTTDALHAAIAAAKMGRRVLAVDLDPQAHLSLSLLADLPEDPNAYIDSALHGRLTEPTKTLVPGLSVIPSHIQLAEILESSVLTRARWDEALLRVIRQFADDFDYAVIDTPATYSRLHTLAFRASDGYLLSLRPEAFSLLGFVESREQVENFKQEMELSNPRFLGFFLNGVPKARRLAVERIREELSEDCEKMGFEVPQDTIFDEARWAGRATKSIFDQPGTTELQEIFLNAWKTIEKRLEA